MTTVRRYEPGDAAAVRRLHDRALRAAGTDPDDVPGTDDLDAIEERYLAHGTFLVAEDDGNVVGMGGLVVDGDEGELFRMRVDPDCQREGIGSAILDGLEAAARRQGVDRLVAETASRQTAAMNFYPNHCYDQVTERTLGEYDLVTFEKQLDGGRS